ncbi:hypothetical protein MTO96_023426 [Rhipicephalus appendiculatus]
MAGTTVKLVGEALVRLGDAPGVLVLQYEQGHRFHHVRVLEQEGASILRIWEACNVLREYINQSTKTVRLECHLHFNYECLNNSVVPRSIYCKTLEDTPYGRKLARDFSRKCLKARVQDNK